MKHAQYYRNIANGIARIAQAVKLCDLAHVEDGSYFSKRFVKENPYSCAFTLDISHLDADSIEALRILSEPNECTNPTRIADGIQGFWFPGGFWCKCKYCTELRHNEIITNNDISEN